MEQARDEVNAKAIHFVEDARAFTTYTLKPQMRTLGPRYGKLLSGIRDALSQMDGNEVVDAFGRGEVLSCQVNGTDISLSEADVLIEPSQKPGFVANTEHGVTVVLDTNLTEALISEGFAREIVSKIQTMRKDADFDVTDHINIAIRCEDALWNTVIAHKEAILSSTLGQTLLRDADDVGVEWKAWGINGVDASIAVWRV